VHFLFIFCSRVFCIPRPGDGLEELVSLTLYLNQIAVVAMSTIFFKKKRKEKKKNSTLEHGNLCKS
jgi:hypothetical protein